MLRKTLSAASLAVITGLLFGGSAEAKIFNNDTFRITQVEADRFEFFINDVFNGQSGVTPGSDPISNSFDLNDIAAILANNGAGPVNPVLQDFFRGSNGITAEFNTIFQRLIIRIPRSFIENNQTGEIRLKYNHGSNGQFSDRNFIRVSAVGLGGDDDGGDDDGGVVIPGGENSRGGAGPFRNDTFTITKSGGSFKLNINGTELTAVADDGGDLNFSIEADRFKELVLANNGVSGSFLGDGTDFTVFLSKGNGRLIDVTLGDNIEFNIDRNFVLNEVSGESSFKYNAGGKNARNFVNFVGVVEEASPMM